MSEEFGELIHSYTRAQAIADGTLIDVTAVAAEAGFRLPVSLTRTVWEDCVAWTDQDTEQTRHPQDQAGRLWDVLFLAAVAGQGQRVSTVEYTVNRVPRDGDRDAVAQPVELVVHIGPGDDHHPVVTIMHPGED